MDSKVSNFGPFIEGKRNECKKSLEEVAYRTGTSVWTLRRWEQGVTFPRANKLASLAAVLGVTVQELTDAIEAPANG